VITSRTDSCNNETKRYPENLQNKFPPQNRSDWDETLYTVLVHACESTSN